MKYADVIVPVAVEGRFTYTVPRELRAAMALGKRVVVEFGRRKLYSGIVARLHDDDPAGGLSLKPVVEVVDASPLVSVPQLRFWKWLAGYYICGEGEVMAAALPAGLKLASESVVCAVSGAFAASLLPPAEREVACILAAEGKMSVARLHAKIRNRNLMATLRSLYDKGVVAVSEEVSGKYRERRQTVVELSGEYSGAGKTGCVLDAAATEAQRRLLREFLRLGGACGDGFMPPRAAMKPVSRAALLAAAECSASPLESLQRRGVLRVFDTEVSRLAEKGGACMRPRSLSAAQSEALASIEGVLAEKDVCLLHGVTSCGKTEIYIHLIDSVLRAGRRVLLLLPEIALTTQITSRLRMYFGDRMGVYHSRFPDAERVEIWKRQLSPRAYDLIVGARSALFLPVENLGLVVVDEEHEPSYKQADPSPRYNARDAAVVLASIHGAKVVLGTATPSLESYHNALAGKYGLVELGERYGDVNMPEIRVENVGELRRKRLMKNSLSPALVEETARALEKGQQAIFFLNRRGFASFLECEACGWVPRCGKCDVSLAYHKLRGRLCCHCCGAEYPLPRVCPDCGGNRFKSHGTGTERIEAEVRALFPTARTARLDFDTTRGREAYGRILDGFREGRADILIGTQMVAKGLDFGRVSVVGILNADMTMNMPDFRSQERAFQMMSQVAGRAGRRKSRGTVILQTSQPEAGVIRQVVGNDYRGMYHTQASGREAFGFPPFCRLVNVYIRSRHLSRADDAARAMAEFLRPYFGGRMLGPASPPVARVKLEHIRLIMVKIPPGADTAGVRLALRRCAASVLGQYNVRVCFDVDPL